MIAGFDVVDALAGLSEDLRSEGEFVSRIHDAVEKLKQERDEARAEIATLTAALDERDVEAERSLEQYESLVRERDEARADDANAYRRGAEAMREACARWMSEREGISQWVYDDALSALPIPEEP
jgi:hypothetical protein